MKRTRKPRTRKKRIGNNLIVLAAVLGLFCSTLTAAKKGKAKESLPHAVIAGTVYRPPGFAMPGVEVAITPEKREVDGVKLKKVEVSTDARGEWAVRVPPVPATWKVDVKRSGYRPEQRSVQIEGEQRLDLSIVLEPTESPKEATR